MYPEIQPYKTHRLKVSPVHEIYVEESGNPRGEAILFIHGGPGGGTNPQQRRFFDPDFYRIILFDQRGAGQSTPNAELTDNTTWHLVDDIEQIRQHLEIKKWHIFGGSWGSTLALTYAIKQTAVVASLILRGIFLCRPSEIKWFYQFGASEIFPDYWETYQKYIPPSERHDFVTAYYKRLTHPDAKIRLEAAKIWSKWEGATSALLLNPSLVDVFDEPEHALAFARIECHYFINNAFFPTNNWILENCHVLKSLPTWIVQGRYDVVCPARSAWDLSKALPQANFYISPDAGHAAGEASNTKALVKATDELKKLTLLERL